MSVLFKVIYNQIEDKEKTRVKSEMEIREIKVKSEKETRKAKAVEKEMKVKSEEKIRKAKEDAKHSARQERTAASQKIAAAASKNKLNLKKSDEVAAGLKKQLTQEKERVAAATSMAKVLVMETQQAEHGSVRPKTRSLEEKYRNVIEKLQDDLKTSNSSFKNATLDLEQKDKEIGELKGVIQVRLHSLTFFV